MIDAQIFAELYQAHLYGIFNYCLFRVGDRTIAEDLTADTFERAWRARKQYQAEKASFNTWLVTIARRVVIDWQRRQSRRPLLRWLSPQQPAETLSPERQFEETEQQAQLRQWIRELKPVEQELIALKFGAGMTNREIAQMIDKSESAVGSALHRIMKKLRTQWKDQR